MLDQLQCESIIVRGVDNPDDVSWLADIIAGQRGIDFRVMGGDADLTVVNDLSVFGSGFSLDGGGNDMLHVGFNAGEPQDGLVGALHGSSVRGLEHLLFDRTRDDDLDALLERGIFETLLDGAAPGGPNEGMDVLLKIAGGESGALEAAGWTPGGETVTINGAEYQPYTNSAEEQLYLQIMNLAA